MLPVLLCFTMIFGRIQFLSFLAGNILPSITNAASASAPKVAVKNGTYIGRHNPTYNEDEFLGIPYAQPPIGSLRFRAPASLNTTWNGTREAVKYSPIVSSNTLKIRLIRANLWFLVVCWLWGIISILELVRDHC